MQELLILVYQTGGLQFFVTIPNPQIKLNKELFRRIKSSHGDYSIIFTSI